MTMTTTDLRPAQGRAGGGPGASVARQAPGSAVQRRAAAPGPASLAAHSNLDQLDQLMTLLNGDLELLNKLLAPLKAIAESMDKNLDNFDEYSKHFEAPAATRAATDAASAVAAEIVDLVGEAQQSSLDVQTLNAAAFLALRPMRDVQDNQRMRGAGPNLLRTAGRV
jgi:hypothetical protein